MTLFEAVVVHWILSFEEFLLCLSQELGLVALPLLHLRCVTVSASSLRVVTNTQVKKVIPEVLGLTGSKIQILDVLGANQLIERLLLNTQT